MINVEEVMNFRKALFFVAAVLVWPSYAAAQCSNSSGSRPALTLNLRPVHETVRLGDPVLVSIVLTNVSKTNVSIWRSPGLEYSVDVRDENKNLAPDTELGRYRNGHVDFSKMRPDQINPKYLNGSGACFPLKPGESLNDEIDVSRLYQLTSGRYLVQVSHSDPITHENVKSNSIVETVTR